MRVTTIEQEVDPERCLGADRHRRLPGGGRASTCCRPSRQPADGRSSELAAEVRGRDPADDGLMAVAEAIPARFEYRSGATFVGSTVADLLEGGAGVCQDFVHLGAMVLRRHGIGARYVSGYLFAAAKDGGEDSVEVQTHAWLEGLLPDDGRAAALDRRRPDQPRARRAPRT